MQSILHALYPFVLLLAFIPTQGQELNEAGIQQRLDLIRNGQPDAVKAELPSLLTKYQNHPGVLYLQAILTSDGSEAARIFQSVVDNFPKSDWADDALYKVYQYYYSIGLYRTATQKYDQLKRAYPSSPYLVQGELSSVNRGDEAAERLGSVDDAGSGTFAVQVGAFSTTENANRQKRFFHSAGYPVEILNKVKGGRSFYLVWIGNFKSYDEAREFGNEVKRRYKINTIVVGR